MREYRDAFNALTKNHLFIDGNKRVAFLAVGLFLGLNGYAQIHPKTINNLYLCLGTKNPKPPKLFIM